MIAKIEIFLDGHWKQAATLTSLNDPTRGFKSASRLEYDVDFVGSYINRPQEAALSVRYPVSFDCQNETHWPAFILDILPSGHARRVWLKRLGILQKTTAPSDWTLLLNGAGNPPGNLRIQQVLPDPLPHPGFKLQDILERQEAFTEYAEQNNAVVAGSSGAQGDAPKMLLVVDYQGRWHADGALPDQQVADHHLVKFPRGNTARDQQVLRNEAAYMKVAKAMGLHVHSDLTYLQNSLFIPRFDREVESGKVIRHGLESLISAAGIADFGLAGSHEIYCKALGEYASNPDQDVLEYVRRDILNFALGNTDNHGRNQAFLKIKGNIQLSPLFDFAPMFLDPQGIARVSRWDRERELPGDSPDWGLVADYLSQWHEGIHEGLLEFTKRLERLPEILCECEVDEEIINRRRPYIENVLKALQEISYHSTESFSHAP